MGVEWMVHVEQSMWNGGGMDGPYGTVHVEWWWNGWSIWNSPCGISLKCMKSIWNDGEMDGPYGTVHVEWWWNGWSIWNSPCGMAVEWMVHMEQSI